MNRIVFLTVCAILFVFTACQNQEPSVDEKPSTAAKENVAKETNTPEADPVAQTQELIGEISDMSDSSIESDIQDIREKYAIISKATHYKTVPFETNCGDNTSIKFVRKYNEKGQLSYLLYHLCAEEGCFISHHYYWDEKLFFIFKQSDITPGVSHIIEERRTYFKGDQVIQCLEKTAHQHEGTAPMSELLKKAENKKVECTSEFLSDILMDIETLPVAEAKKYFCPDSKEILESFESSDCYKHLEKESFSCECYFSNGGGNKESALFVSDMEANACVKLNGQLNALYPDWEDRDYKAELKQLANSKPWVSVSGDEVLYFGKPLGNYKYANAVDFLTDLILASGKDIETIPMQATTGGTAFDQVKTNNQKAIAEAKDYKAKGGNDPLSIMKYDNRSYDVIVRYRQITQYEGEANQYEGNITLLPNRGTEILETRKIKGSCGC